MLPTQISGTAARRPSHVVKIDAGIPKPYAIRSFMSELQNSLLELVRRTSAEIPDDVNQSILASLEQEKKGTIAESALKIIVESAIVGLFDQVAGLGDVFFCGAIAFRGGFEFGHDALRTGGVTCALKRAL